MTNVNLTLGTAQATAHTALGEVAVNIENSIIQMPLDSATPFTTDRGFLHTPSHQGLQNFDSLKNEAVREIVEKVDRAIPGSIHFVEMLSAYDFVLWLDMGIAIARGEYPASAGKTLTRNGRDVQCEPLVIEQNDGRITDEYGEELSADECVLRALDMVGLS